MLRRPRSGAVPVPLSYSPEQYPSAAILSCKVPRSSEHAHPGVCVAQVSRPAARAAKGTRSCGQRRAVAAEWPPVPTLATRPGCPSITGACPLRCACAGGRGARSENPKPTSAAANADLATQGKKTRNLKKAKPVHKGGSRGARRSRSACRPARATAGWPGQGYAGSGLGLGLGSGLARARARTGVRARVRVRAVGFGSGLGLGGRLGRG